MTIERVRAVIDAATPGPWEPKLGSLYPAEPQPGAEVVELADGGEAFIGVWPILSGENASADARAIVLAHDLMPELLALWEAAQAVVDAAEAHTYLGEMSVPTTLIFALRAALAALDAKAEEVLG